MKNLKEKLFSVILSCAMIISLVPSMGMHAQAAGLTWKDVKNTIRLQPGVLLPKMDDNMEVKKLTEDTTELSGWYIVEGNVKAGQFKLSGDTNIILKDDAKLEATDFRNKTKKYNLTFWTESMSSGSIEFTDCGRTNIMVQDLTINGGEITAHSSVEVIDCKNLTVYGGSLRILTSSTTKDAISDNDLNSINLYNWQYANAGISENSYGYYYGTWKVDLVKSKKYVSLACSGDALHWEKVTPATRRIIPDSKVDETEALGYVLNKLGENNLSKETIILNSYDNEKCNVAMIAWDDTLKRYIAKDSRYEDLESVCENLKETDFDTTDVYVIGYAIDSVADSNKENKEVFYFMDEAFRNKNVINDNKIKVTMNDVSFTMSDEKLEYYENAIMAYGTNTNIDIRVPENKKIKQITFYFHHDNKYFDYIAMLPYCLSRYSSGRFNITNNYEKQINILADGSPAKLEYDNLSGTGTYVAPEASNVKELSITSLGKTSGIAIDKIEVEYECAHSSCISKGNAKHKCKDCGYEENHNMTKTISAKVAPTCTADGKEAVIGCTACDYKEGGAKITAIGHKFVNGVCSVCGSKDGSAQEFTKVKKPGFEKTKITILIGDKVNSRFVNPNKQKVTYKSSNKKVVKVDTKGKLTAVKKGKAKITAIMGGKKYKLTVTVAKPRISGKSSVKVGKKITLSIKNSHSKIRWKSSNKKIAAVNKNGVVKGRKKGKVTITATYNKKKYKKNISVFR